MHKGKGERRAVYTQTYTTLDGKADAVYAQTHTVLDRIVMQWHCDHWLR